MNKRVASYIEAEYTKIELLKKTEHSSIWLAKDGTGQIVVVKHLSTTGLPFRKLKEIAHPLWPRILFTAEEDGTTWVVEEYVSGNTLAALLETGKIFTTGQAREIMLQILDGMTAFHQAGIVHRDIKPSNIILQGGTHVRLIDFGVSRLMHPEEDKADTRAFGTSGYAPPEQYGFGQTDAKSDIYALGVTIKELLGKDYRGQLTPILDKCTAFSPKDRYQSAEQLKKALLRQPYYQKLRMGAMLLLTSCAVVGVFLWSWQSQPPIRQCDETVEEKSTTETQVPLPQEDTTLPQENAKPEIPPASVAPPIEDTPIIPQPIPDTAGEPPKKLTADDIGLYLALGGKTLGAGGKYNITLPKTEWEAWEAVETTPLPTKYFPADWNIALTIENRSNIPIEKATLEAAINEDATTERFDTAIPPGSTARIVIPLSGRMLQCTGKYIWLSFSSDTPHLKSSSFSYYIWINPETD